MSNSQHAPEPWSHSEDESFLRDAEGKGVLPIKANARRIVACVNACWGLSTDDLEKSGLVSAVGYELQRLQVQRDELLAAVADLLKWGAITELCTDKDLADCAADDNQHPSYRKVAAATLRGRQAIVKCEAQSC